MQPNVVLLRSLTLLGSGLVTVLGSRAVGVPGVGATACLTLAFLAGIKWRREQGKTSKVRGSTGVTENPSKRFNVRGIQNLTKGFKVLAQTRGIQ